jgi:hypothetical protein
MDRRENWGNPGGREARIIVSLRPAQEPSGARSTPRINTVVRTGVKNIIKINRASNNQSQGFLRMVFTSTSVRKLLIISFIEGHFKPPNAVCHPFYEKGLTKKIG